MRATTSQHHKHKTIRHPETHHSKHHHHPKKQKPIIKRPQILILVCFFVFLFISLLIISGKFLNNDGTRSLTNQKQYYYGVGVGITFRGGQAVVSRVIPGTPAEKAGILPNDVIIMVDSIPVNTENSRNLCREIRGQDGSLVDLSILRQNKTLDKKLSRTKIYSRTPTMCQ